MAVKRSLLLLAFLLPLQASWAAAEVDWRADARNLLASEKDFPLLVESLQKRFPELADRDKAAASLIIGYCQARIGNAQAELFWMEKYLGEFRAAAANLAFLPAPLRKKILDFRLSWQREFPVLWELALAREDAEIAYFDPPAELRLRLQASLPCEFQLLSREGTLLAKGALAAGVETVKLPAGGDFVRAASHSYRLLLVPRNAPGRTIEKYFAVEAEVAAPAEAEFDRAAGTLALKGRALQAEQETETKVVSQGTRFDKGLFKKTVLKDLLIGAAFFVVNATLIRSSLDNADTSLVAKSSLFGARRAFTLAGVGFSLSALSKLPKVFQRERRVEETRRDLPEARAANLELRRDLERLRGQVRLRLAVRAL